MQSVAYIYVVTLHSIAVYSLHTAVAEPFKTTLSYKSVIIDIATNKEIRVYCIETWSVLTILAEFSLFT